MDLMSGAAWGAFGAIVVANILLSGDNAVVIAMAARSLPPRQQKKATSGPKGRWARRSARSWSPTSS
jgi:predicted tellurium resistance membrane protein TerC